MKMRLLLSVVVGLFCVSASSLADTIVFYDDFERGTFGTEQTIRALEAITVDQPAIGLWTVTGEDTDYGFKAEWHPEGGYIPDSHVFGGKKFAMTIRSGLNIAGGTYTNVNATFAQQSGVSDVVRFETDFWGQGDNCDLKLALLSGDTELNAITLHGASAGGSILVGGVDTGLTFALDAWHHLTIEYSPMASTFSIALNGQTPVTGLATTPSAVDGLRFAQTSTGQNRWSVYDNVSVSVSTIPEPSSLMLMLGFGLGIAAYAWRKRK